MHEYLATVAGEGLDVSTDPEFQVLQTVYHNFLLARDALEVQLLAMSDRTERIRRAMKNNMDISGL